MPRNARIPQVDISDNRLLTIVDLLGGLILERGAGDGSWLETTKVARQVIADIMWVWEQRRLEAMVTTAGRIEVCGVLYRRVKQFAGRVYHGLYGAHAIEEPVYRKEGVRNGATVRPLDHVVGVVAGSLLPDLAQSVGREATDRTSREVEKSLQGLGFRPPSRATLQKRTADLFADMHEAVVVLEEQVRAEETLDFELAAISCGLDRFAVRMDSDLPEGELREEKLAAQQTRQPAYRRTPPAPFETGWRMAYAANVTMYDANREPRRTIWTGTDADGDVAELVSRIVADIIHLVGNRIDVPITVVQDGALELDVLPDALKRLLPEPVRLRVLTDFPHAISYLDAVVSARDDHDPHNYRSVYRYWLLDTPNGAERVVRHLRCEFAKAKGADDGDESALLSALRTALSYFEKRRPRMKYQEARAEGSPIGSGATESTCKIHQHRVKRSGSHWRTSGLRGVMTARALAVSGRFDRAFAHHQATLCSDVRLAA